MSSRLMRDIILPAAVVGLLLAAITAAGLVYSFATQRRPGAHEGAPRPGMSTPPEPQALAKADPSGQAARAASAAGPLTSPAAPAPTSLPAEKDNSTARHVAHAKACLAAAPPDLEGAATSLQLAEASARQAGMNWPPEGMPTAASVRQRIEEFRSLVRQAAALAEEEGKVEDIRVRLDKAKAMWDHPDVEACLRGIGESFFARIAIHQSQGRYEQALQQARQLQTLRDTSRLGELIKELERGVRDPATAPAGGGPQRQARLAMDEVERILQANRFHGKPRMRLTAEERASLARARQQVLQAAGQAGPGQPTKPLLELLDAWLASATTPASRVLSLSPRECDVVALADLQAMRRWPGLADVVGDWFDQAQTQGLTRDVAQTLRALGLRPFGAASHVGLISRVDPNGQLASSFLAATHVGWQDLSRAIGAAFAGRFREGTKRNFPGLWVIGTWVLSPGEGIVLIDAGDLGGQLGGTDSPGATSLPAERSVWDVAGVDDRGEDLWLAARRLPANVLRALPVLRKVHGLLLKARMGDAALTLDARFDVDEAQAAAFAEELRSALARLPQSAAPGSQARPLLEQAVASLDVSAAGGTVRAAVVVPAEVVAKLLAATKQEMIAEPTSRATAPRRPQHE